MDISKNGRVLFYTCCDKKYSHFIPTLVMSVLWSNKDVDIEIHMDGFLDSSERNIINYLTDRYKDSKVLIKENCFNTIVNGQKILKNTVRFVSEPEIKNEFTYICDIDILYLEDIKQPHIENMEKNGLNYSNMIRKGTDRMTGLHFTRTEAIYPLNLKGIDLKTNDEIVLFNVVKNKGNRIDRSLTFRPQHGVHMSLNRPTVGGTDKIPGWFANDWKQVFIELYQTDMFSFVYDRLHEISKNQINKLLKFYSIT